MQSASEHIVIGFSTYKKYSPVSATIRAVEQTPFSHVYIRFYSKSYDRWLVYQASQTRLNFMNVDHFLSVNTVLEEYAIPCSAKQKTQVIQYCIDNVSRPYGKLNLLGIVLARIVKACLNISIPNPLHDGGKTQVCSELGGRVLNLLGGRISDQQLELVGPRAVRDMVKVFPAVFRVHGEWKV